MRTDTGNGHTSGEGPVLKVEGLRKEYGVAEDVHLAIANVSLSVTEEELVTIVGPSGCGKTTMLRCIAGLLTPTAGDVFLDGEPVRTVPRGIGFVFQQYTRSLMPWLTVWNNVAFPLKRGWYRTQHVKERVAESLESVGLSDAASRYPAQLSGGMQQRVTLARALACRPRVLLMDEPFGSVDAHTRMGLEDLLLSVRDRFGMTILLVTHDIDESIYLGNRVAVLSTSPAAVVAELEVDLPHHRNQVDTRELDEFVRLRALVARHIFGGPQDDARKPELLANDATPTHDGKETQ